MGKKRYWHRKQLEITGNTVPATQGRRRNSNDPWQHGYSGYITHCLNLLFTRLSTMIITPKLKRYSKVPGTNTTKEEFILEVRIHELALFIFFVNTLSLVFVSTEFVPDEYWQSTEVAHKYVYGEGHLTWEWDYGLRSYIFPLIHMGYFKFLQLLGWDYPSLMMILPRTLNFFLMTVGEFHFFLAGTLTYGVISSVYSTLLMLTSWFVFYCTSRLITNTTETALNMVAMYYYNSTRLKMFILTLAVNFSLRPTAIVPWIPQLCVLVTKTPRQIIPCFIVGILTLGVLTYIDSCMYGDWVLPIWNFLRFNFFQGRSSEFGTHPLFWYIYNAIPSILLLDTLTFFEMFIKARNYPKYFLNMTSITTFFAFFSIVGHKEIRFVLPVLPFVYSVMGDYLYTAVRQQNEGKKLQDYKLFTKTMWVSLIVHILVAIYLSGEHQGAIKPAAHFINNDIFVKDNANPNIWIMMPCYTVPVYTYLHHPNAHYEYFTCGPARMGLEDKMPNFQVGDFTAINISLFVEEKLVQQGIGAPDYIMVFSGASQSVQTAVQSFSYTYERCFHLRHVRIDETLHPKDIHVLCRTA